MKKLLLPIAMGILFACNTGERKDSVDAAKDINEEKNEQKSESNPGTTASPTTTAPTAVSDKDQKFVVEAASGGLMEVQLGQMLSQNATDAGVKDFAQKMVTDHGQVNDELKALAARKNITIPTTPGEDERDDMDKLNKKKGRDLDKEYISLMVDDHKDDVDKFEKAANDCDDPEIKAFAAKHLPHLKMHLQTAQQLRDRLKK